MDLSLATTTTSSDHEQDQRDQEASNIGASSSSGTGNNNNLMMMMAVEKEHMFDKVVTPSDVGKLNRLVIPKQHAEKYFPLDSSNNQNGTLLNFQDRNGKMWRFRYSYWNSSQSYVMTKGWSRFVKEKKLDAGDIVSFQRGIGGESERSRLFIDWRHRPDMTLVPNHHHHHHHQFGNFGFNFNFPTSSSHQYSNTRLLPPPIPEYSIPISRNLNIGNRYQHQHQHQHELIGYGYGSNLAGRYYYNGSPLDQRNIGVGPSDPLVIESIPVVPGRITPVMFSQQPPPPPPPAAAGKRLRLFGVNMEFGTDSDQQYHNLAAETTTIMQRGEIGTSSERNLFIDDDDDDDDDDGDDPFAKKGKSSSFSLNFNPREKKKNQFFLKARKN